MEKIEENSITYNTNQEDEYVSSDDIELLIPHVLNHRIELAPGVNNFDKILQENMQKPLDELAKSTLKK